MLTIALASILAASNAAPYDGGSQRAEPIRYCRAMVIGYSRSGDVKICKTKAQWDDFDSCRGPTRYCSAEQKAALSKKHATAFALSEDSRIVCRIVSATGSRLRSERACLPQREWQRMWDSGREEMGDLQNHQSKQSPESSGGRR
jgi:hypothetical protein